MIGLENSLYSLNLGCRTALKYVTDNTSVLGTKTPNGKGLVRVILRKNADNGGNSFFVVVHATRNVMQGSWLTRITIGSSKVNGYIHLQFATTTDIVHKSGLPGSRHKSWCGRWNKRRWSSSNLWCGNRSIRYRRGCHFPCHILHTRYRCTHNCDSAYRITLLLQLHCLVVGSSFYETIDGRFELTHWHMLSITFKVKDRN
mmetsp:Transcript_3017/g.4686  ORF Transcript_3017/g.4686 Transcript_3017/m.4686 type:complete len:201 (+) Transcript_3017:937-1539(+)